MNDSELHTTPIQSLTNRIPTNFDNSNLNLLAQDSQISLPKDQDQADYQNILPNWDSLNAEDSPEEPDFTIDNKSTRINPRKAIHRPLNQKKDQTGLVVMGMAQELVSVAKETSAERARRNWLKVREGYKKYKAELKMSNLLHDRDDHVMFGERPGDISVKMARRSWKEFYIDPRNKWLLFWEAVFHVTIVFHIVVHTYRISFNSGLYNQDPLDVVVETMDLCYFLNIILKFFVAVRNPDESLITKHSAIAKNFLKNGTLILDIFSIIPLDLIIDELGLFKLLRLVHLTRLSKSMNFVVHKILVFVKFDGLQALILSNFLGNLIAVTLQLLIIFHFCTCVWISLGYPQYPGERTWFINIPDFDYDFGSNELIGGNISVYLSSLFFASQTLTTIGYGSPTGYSNREYLFCMGMLFFGLLIFTYFYEKIKTIITSLNEAERIENQEVIELDSWLNMIERNVIENLEVVNEILISSFKKVLHHKIDQDWQEMFVENEQYKHLDPRAKKEVLRIAFYSLKKRFNILFKALSDDFIHHILVLCESRIYLPQEVIISKGSHPPGLFLILEGSVILSTESIKSSFLRLSTDSFFGEMMLTTKKSSSFNYIAERTVSCLFIDEKVFTKVDAKFAEDINNLRALAFYRNRAFLKEKHRYNKRQEHITRLRKIKTVGFDSIKGRSIRDTSLPRSNNASTLIIGPNESPLLRVNIMRRQNTIDPKSETNYFSGGQAQETSMIKDDSVFSLTPSPVIFKGVRKGTAEFNNIFGLDLDGKPEEDVVSLKKANLEDFRLSPNLKENNEERKEKFEEEEEDSPPKKNSSSSSSSSSSSDSSSSSSESDEYSSDEEDELNNSDLFPIERDFPEMDEKKIDTESVLEFLEEKFAFVEHRFDHMKNRFNSDLIFASGKSKLLTKKSFSKI